jgi:hypothetical protein
MPEKDDEARASIQETLRVLSAQAAEVRAGRLHATELMLAGDSLMIEKSMNKGTQKFKKSQWRKDKVHDIQLLSKYLFPAAFV